MLPKFNEKGLEHQLDGQAYSMYDIRHYESEKNELFFMMYHKCYDSKKLRKVIEYHARALSKYQTMNFTERLMIPSGYLHSLAIKDTKEYIKNEM